MCILNIRKQARSSFIFVILFICHNSNGHYFKRSPVGETSQNLEDVNAKIISEEDPTNPGAGPSKPEKMPHAVARRQSVATFSRLYLCKWLNPREELLSLPMCTRTGDFPYLNECRVFRHCINVGSTTVKACCPVGFHFDHILRECVNAKDARCLTRDLEDQFMDSAFYEESAIDLPHTDVVHVDDYLDDVHDDIVDVRDYDDDDDSEPLDDSFEVIDPTVLANNDKAWKYYPAPPHLYPGAFWSHNPYTGRMEPGKVGYAMPIWMSYNVEPVQKIRQPRRKRPTKKPLEENEKRSTEEFDQKEGLGDQTVSGEGNKGEDKEENKIDFSGQSFDENDKSSPRPSSQPPSQERVTVTPVTTAAPVPIPVNTPSSSSEISLVIPMIPVQPPAPPPPFATFKPATKPPVELVRFTTDIPASDEDNGFEVEKNPETNTTPKLPIIVTPQIPMDNGPVGKKSNEPPPPIMGIPGNSGFEDSSEEGNGSDKKKRSGEIGDHDVHQVVTQTTTPRQVGNDGGRGGQSEKQLSVLPDFENSSEQDEISNGGAQRRTINLAAGRKQGNQNVEQVASQPSPKRKRQVPMSMMRRMIARPRPDYFYYNY